MPNFTDGFSTRNLHFHDHSYKNNVVFVMGATGTGKSRLSIDLAECFNGAVINSDKMQVYKGLDVVTNKVTEQECKGIPHHLLGFRDPDLDYTATHFGFDAINAIESIIQQDKLPIIAGGSNSFIEYLVEYHPSFSSWYHCCFLWVDVNPSILEQFVSIRVDRMIEQGFVDEVRGIFCPDADYKQGVRRAIGVPEMDSFLRAERDSDCNPKTLEILLQIAIDDVKRNTRTLSHRQRNKIRRLRELWNWNIHRIDATAAFSMKRMDSRHVWEKQVVNRSKTIVDDFCNTKYPKNTQHHYDNTHFTPKFLVEA